MTHSLKVSKPLKGYMKESTKRIGYLWMGRVLYHISEPIYDKGGAKAFNEGTSILWDSQEFLQK